MLTHIGRHGLFDLKVEAAGDLHIDLHHTVEDVGICLGTAHRPGGGGQDGHLPLRPRQRADGRGPGRHRDRPVRPAVLVYNVNFPGSKIGQFDTELVHEFCAGLLPTTPG